MDRRNTSAAVHQRLQKTHHSHSISKIQVLHAEMHHKIYQITTSLFPDRESEVEHHHPSQGAEQTLLHTRGSKWLLLSHLQGRKLILSKALFLDRLEATRTLLCCL